MKRKLFANKYIKVSLLLFSLFILGALNSGLAQAQFCGPTGGCFTDDDCRNDLFAPCPACFRCEITPVAAGVCVPEAANCDDGNACTVDTCEFDPVNNVAGCVYQSLVVVPDPPGPPDDLPIECYICEPTANQVNVDNGICDEAAGENCSNSTDCQEAGVPCGPPPPPDPGACDGPSDSVICADGDRCTEDRCEFQANTPVCVNDPRTCEADADGCCPAGCNGPDPANPTLCRDAAGAPIPNCDADCWYPQSCGDGQVQPPETCDDTANAGNAGVSPLGATVSDEQCRDPGALAECTYCGDGIIQTNAGEQCEFNDTSACGVGGGCDPNTCQCVSDLCVTGSGQFWDTIRTGCGNCSLNPQATSQGWWVDYRAFFFLLALLGTAWMVRRRVS